MNNVFDFGKGILEPAHQHPNGGGWVAESAFVEDTCFVGAYATVYDNAVVIGNAKINDYAKVYGNAQVSDNAKVYGEAEVYDFAKILKNARVSGKAKVYENAIVTDSSLVYDDAKVHGKVVLKDMSEIFESAEIYGDFQTEKYTKIYNECVVTRQPTILNAIGTSIIFTDHHISISCTTLPPSAWLKYGMKMAKVTNFAFGGNHTTNLSKEHLKLIYEISQHHGCTERQEDLDKVRDIVKKLLSGDTQDRIMSLERKREYASNAKN